MNINNICELTLFDELLFSQQLFFEAFLSFIERKKNLVILIQKDVMKEIKKIFDYKYLLSVFKKANIIEHIIR